MGESGSYFRIGDIEVAVVSDGSLWLDGGTIFGLVPRVMWEPITGPTARIAGIVTKSPVWRKSEYRFGFFSSNFPHHKLKRTPIYAC